MAQLAGGPSLYDTFSSIIYVLISSGGFEQGRCQVGWIMLVILAISYSMCKKRIIYFKGDIWVLSSIKDPRISTSS